MKNCLLASLLVATTGFSQTTLNNTHIQSEAGAYSMSIFLDSTLIYKTKGANKVWDFSQVVATDQVARVYNPMSAAAIFSQFYFGSGASKANYFIKATDLPIADIAAGSPIPIEGINQFIQVNATAVKIVGFEFLLSGQGIPAKSDTIETVYELPLTYSKTWNSRGYTNLDMTALGFPAVIRQHRYRQSEVDGWGTVKTPYGEFTCLRIHHRIEETDSIKIDLGGGEQWIPLALPTAHEYEWRSTDKKEAIFRVKTSETPAGEQITSTEFLDNDTELGLSNEVISVSISPNPFTDKLVVTSAEKITNVSLINGLGERVLVTVPNTTSYELITKNLVSGTYLMEVTTVSGNSIQRIVKI